MRMHVKLVIIFVTTWCQIGLHAEQDNNPLVTRRRMFIYRIVEDVQVEYTQCRYFDSKHPAVAYSDITENCIKALDSGTFKDKWGEENNLGSSVIKLTRYITIADPIRNEIKLKSGTICRYDRGFCYDDKEKENTAFVWKVERNTDKNSVKACPGKVEQSFYGSVDIWEFPRERLKYLFYSDIASSKAFYLRLKDKVKCSNVDTWNTEGNDFVISSLKLTSQIKKTTTIDEHYLPLQPIEKVSEDLMKNRDLQKYPLDFNPPITNEYFEEPDNLKIMFRKLREEMKVETSKAIKSGENSLNIKSISNKIHEFDRLIIERDTKIEQINGTLLSMGDRLVETNGYIRSVQNLLDISSSKCNQDVANLKETFLESSARTLSENKQSLELAVGESIILGRKLKMLEDFVKKQASIYLTEAEIEKKILSLKEVSNEKIKELDNKLQSIVELDEQYNSSLKDIQNECRGIDGRIGNLLNNFDSKLNIIEQSVTGNFTFVKIIRGNCEEIF
ncbi:hypothetical protein JTB14_035725 [Gonioctena quinquepunctata]|nr:hypothetical protein JTB14_035725 [Gonioctena quinquepunctata]